MLFVKIYCGRKIFKQLASSIFLRGVKMKKIKIKKLLVFQIATVVLAVALIASFAMKTGCFVYSSSAIGEKTTNFINNNLLPEGLTAKLVSSGKENGMYKVVININGETQGQQVDSDFTFYVSSDGSLLFDSRAAIPMNVSTTNEKQQQQQQQEIPKRDTPEVKLFVMSYCPYGTQMEKGIIPVVELLGNKIDFKVEFVNYAMHGKEELDENLLQVCIQREYKEKYIDYLKCFLEAGDSQGCIAKLGFDNTTLTNCINEIDEQYNVTEMYNDKSTWLSGYFPRFLINDEDNQKYGVQGSPTLVINDVVVSASRDPASLLNVICSAFTNPPEECSTQLSSETPSPGFGFEGTGTNSGICS